jgi:hypothetical protein
MVIYRIFGDGEAVPNEGIAIYATDYAYIMTLSGETFETLNKPRKAFLSEATDVSKIDTDIPKNSLPEKRLVEHVNNMCEESLSPRSFENWEVIISELRANRSELKP